MSNLMDNSQLIAGLIENVTGVTVINMASANYSMTLADVMAGTNVIVNTGDGSKTLTIPAAFVGYIAAEKNFIIQPGNKSITIEIEGTSHSEIMLATDDLSVPVDSSVIAYPFGIYSVVTRASYIASCRLANGISTVTDTTDVINQHCGQLLQMNNALAKSFNFSATNVANMMTNSTGKLRMKGAGIVTITASGGATVEGKTTMALNDIFTWTRDGSTNNIVIG